MLKVKSFKITDDVGMNDLLNKFRIAKNAQILVSEGHIVIPYEDGQEISGEPLKNLHLEMRNEQITQLRVLEQAQAGLALQVVKFKDEMRKIDKVIDESADSTTAKDGKKLKQVLENKIAQTSSIIENNKHEENRLKTNIEAIDTIISSLS